MNTGTHILKEKLKNISHKAGVYRMLDKNDVVLYVGKAKNLHNRLTQYTHTDALSYRIAQMVSQINDVIVIETAGETEALLLENDLIKKYKPFYNILLKDDKSFPYILLTQDDIPRLIKYRGSQKIKGTYFGPFSSSLAIKQTMVELQKIFGLRTCNNTSFNNRTRPCLLYQINRCCGPCCDCISKNDYMKNVALVKQFMRGEKIPLQQNLQKQMQVYANNLEYEKAGQIRDKILALNHIQNTRAQDLPKNTDIIAVYKNNTDVCIQIFFYRTGKSEGNSIHFLTDIENISESLSPFLLQFYETIPAPRHIYIYEKTEEGLDTALSQKAQMPVEIHHTISRNYKKLMDQALQNASQAYHNHIATTIAQDTVWDELKSLLQINKLDTIEIYDNSHIQGCSAVGAMVCAGPKGFLKNKYRKFNIDATLCKTNDDFGMMRHVMHRRLKRGLAENNLPDAMIIDGGKGQLSSVLEMMNEFNITSIALLAVAKGENRNAGQETLFLGTHPNTPIHLDLKSPLIHLIQRLRDESHRFAIGSHRQKRAKNMFHETLLDIEGIGAKRKKELLAYFGSPKAIASASLEQIMSVPKISEKIAKKVYTFYHD